MCITGATTKRTLSMIKIIGSVTRNEMCKYWWGMTEKTVLIDTLSLPPPAADHRGSFGKKDVARSPITAGSTLVSTIICKHLDFTPTAAGKIFPHATNSNDLLFRTYALLLFAFGFAAAAPLLLPLVAVAGGGEARLDGCELGRNCRHVKRLSKPLFSETSTRCSFKCAYSDSERIAALSVRDATIALRCSSDDIFNENVAMARSLCKNAAAFATVAVELSNELFAMYDAIPRTAPERLPLPPLLKESLRTLS